MIAGDLAPRIIQTTQTAAAALGVRCGIIPAAMTSPCPCREAAFEKLVAISGRAASSNPWAAWLNTRSTSLRPSRCASRARSIMKRNSIDEMIVSLEGTGYLRPPTRSERTAIKAPRNLPAELRCSRHVHAKNDKYLTGPKGPASAVCIGKKREKHGAGDEIRTHDPNLGKVVLYP